MELEIAYDEMLNCLAIYYPRLTDEDAFIEELQKNEKVNGFIIELLLNELIAKKLIERCVISGKDGAINFIKFTPEGSMFLSMEGFVKQREIYNNNIKVLELALESHKLTKASLEINTELKQITKINTRWVIIGACVAIILLLISPDSKELFHKLSNLILCK